MKIFLYSFSVFILFISCQINTKTKFEINYSVNLVAGSWLQDSTIFFNKSNASSWEDSTYFEFYSEGGWYGGENLFGSQSNFINETSSSEDFMEWKLQGEKLMIYYSIRGDKTGYTGNLYRKYKILECNHLHLVIKDENDNSVLYFTKVKYRKIVDPVVFRCSNGITPDVIVSDIKNNLNTDEISMIIEVSKSKIDSLFNPLFIVNRALDLFEWDIYRVNDSLIKVYMSLPFDMLNIDYTVDERSLFISFDLYSMSVLGVRLGNEKGKLIYNDQSIKNAGFLKNYFTFDLNIFSKNDILTTDKDIEVVFKASNGADYVINNKSGNLHLNLPICEFYIISIYKKGYITKIIEIDAQGLPMDVNNSNKEIQVNITMELLRKKEEEKRLHFFYNKTVEQFFLYKD